MAKGTLRKTNKGRDAVADFVPDDDDVLSQAVWQMAARSNAKVKKTLNNNADLTSLMPLTLLTVGLAEFLRRPTAPKWNEWVWYAYSMFRDLNTQKRKVPHFHSEEFDEGE